jgi:hypothetical protein
MNRRGDPLNLIRVMPAKGQDHVTMATSVFLAKLIGPILLVMGLGLLVNARSSRAMAEEFLRSDALIYLSGLISLTAGLAVVLTHSVWTADWRVVITLLGWLATLGGVFRILLPQQVQALGRAVLARPVILTVAASVLLALGALLAFAGHFR